MNHRRQSQAKPQVKTAFRAIVLASNKPRMELLIRRLRVRVPRDPLKSPGQRGFSIFWSCSGTQSGRCRARNSLTACPSSPSFGQTYGLVLRFAPLAGRKIIRARGRTDGRLFLRPTSPPGLRIVAPLRTPNRRHFVGRRVGRRILVCATDPDRRSGPCISCPASIRERPYRTGMAREAADRLAHWPRCP